MFWLKLIPALLLALWLLVVAGVRAEARMEVSNVNSNVYNVVPDVLARAASPEAHTLFRQGWENLSVLPVLQDVSGYRGGEALTPEVQVRLSIEAWFPESEWLTAECVAKRESELNPFARGRAGEVGVFQTHPIHAWAYDWERLESGDIDYQVAVAHNQWEGSGWWPTWTTARICGG